MLFVLVLGLEMSFLNIRYCWVCPKMSSHIVLLGNTHWFLITILPLPPQNAGLDDDHFAPLFCFTEHGCLLPLAQKQQLTTAKPSLPLLVERPWRTEEQRVRRTAQQRRLGLWMPQQGSMRLCPACLSRPHPSAPCWAAVAWQRPFRILFPTWIWAIHWESSSTKLGVPMRAS